MKTSEKTDKVLPKLFKLKQQLQPVKKDSSNPFFDSTYADLNAHISAVEPLAQELGLFISATPMRDPNNGLPYLETRITDVESQQYVASEANLVMVKQDPQAAGSSITYFRRYSLNAMLNMRAVDDDSETAMGRGKTAQAMKPDASKVRSSFRKGKTMTVSPTEVQNEAEEWS